MRVVKAEKIASSNGDDKKQCNRLVWQYFQHFCKETTIHGMNIVGQPKLHVLERLLWLSIIIAATWAAVTVCISNLTRFSANPTVISIEKDYRNWENIFPAATACFDDKVDVQKAEKYIQNTWGVGWNHERFQYYLTFLYFVSNVTYHNFKDFADYKDDKSLVDIDMVDLVTKIHPTLSGSLVTVEKRQKTAWHLIQTEMGVCFTFNSKLTNLLSIKNGDVVDNDGEKTDILKCHYLNGLCYARFDSDPERPLKYYIHSHIEAPQVISKFTFEIGQSEELEVDFKMIETDFSPDIRSLNPSQRNCRFEDELLTADMGIYSSATCQMACRKQLAIQLCGCKPHFYPFLDGQLCTISGLLCLSKYVDKLTRPAAEIGCVCQQPCRIITYLPLNPKFTKWEIGGYFDQRITFRWGLLHPTTKYRRNIIFGFGDFIVSLGGTYNLFLGISFITLIEVFFLICESFIMGLGYFENRKRVRQVQPWYGSKAVKK